MTDRSQSSLEVLRKARELLSDPVKWTRGEERTFARNAAGKRVAPTDPSAACFCAFGALMRAFGGHRIWDGPALYLEQAVEEVACSGVIYWNDHIADHADILSAFDKAIELAAQSQGSADAGPHSSSPSTGL
jgi:hypothetical protein